MTGRRPTIVDGGWDAGFTPVADLFAELVADCGERGALAVMVDGRTVLDIRGGLADPRTGRRWSSDTLACCFSVSKGVLSLLAHAMIDAGLMDPEWPVARLWPEFAAGGKEAITIADVLTHRAGLPAVSVPVERGDLYDWNRMLQLLAASEPVVTPGSTPTYHNMTYGYLLGEILRRAGDAPLLELLAQRLTGPLEADFHFALAPLEQARAAYLAQDDPDLLFRTLDSAPHTLFARSMRFFARGEDFNSTRWRGAVIGSGSGHATAHAVARLYGQLVWEGSILSPGRQAAAIDEQARSDGPDAVMGMPIRHAMGFELSLPPALDFGPNPDTAGYWGAGGATGFADPAVGLSFRYVTGNMASGFGSSDRCRSLVAALYGCL